LGRGGRRGVGDGTIRKSVGDFLALSRNRPLRASYKNDEKYTYFIYILAYIYLTVVHKKYSKYISETVHRNSGNKISASKMQL